MSTHAEHGRIPEITLGWRLKMALGETSVQEMSDTLGVHRGTIGRWMRDEGARPKRAYLAQWALATGVDYDWLESGTAPATDPHGPDGGVPVTSRYADVAMLTSMPRLSLVA